MRESIFSMTSSFLTHEAAIVQVRKKGEKKHSVQKLLLKYEQHLLPFLVYLLAYSFFFNVGQRIRQLSKTNQPGKIQTLVETIFGSSQARSVLHRWYA